MVKSFRDPMTIVSAAAFAFFSALVVFARSMPSVWYLLSAGAAITAAGLAAYQYWNSSELKTLPLSRQLHEVMSWTSRQLDSLSVLALTVAGVGFTAYTFIFVGFDSPRWDKLLLIAIAMDVMACAALAIQPYTRPELRTSWQLMLIRREVFHFVWTVACIGLFHVLVLWFWDTIPVSAAWFAAVFLICGLTALLQAARVLVLWKANRTCVIQMPDIPPA